MNPHRSTTRSFRSVASAALALIVFAAPVAPLAAQGQAPAPSTKKAPAPTPTITLTTKPSPATMGTTTFMVTAMGVDQKPITGADVTVALQMPGMPAMNMPEMKSSVTLKPVSDKPEDAGKYTGTGPIAMAGSWNVTISVKVGGKEVASKKQTLTAK
jgi:hypothetical protein